MLNEATIDPTKLYFHGSSEARVDHLDAPSYEHPFYVTSDLHYAMAFCTKQMSSTGEWKGITKTFTPADKNYVYIVTMDKSAKLFDFRDRKNKEFADLAKVIPTWILKKVIGNMMATDIYDFCVDLYFGIIKHIILTDDYEDYSRFYKVNAMHELSGTPKLTEKEYDDAYQFCRKLGYKEEMDIHEVMAPILKGLHKLGYKGIITTEIDSNDEDDTRHDVRTKYAIGVFDASAMDRLCLTPMKYKWLKKVNPTYK